MADLAQCGDTDLHIAHDDCPGLDGTEVPNPALAVSCTDCLAPAGEPCRTSVAALAGTTHAARRRSADLFALTQGTCDLCGRFMVFGSVDGAPVDAWHPDPTDHACPPLPDPARDWNAYAAAINSGLSPGHPGILHFVTAAHPTPELLAARAAATPPRLLFCRECSEGKHPNCDGTAWDNEADAPAACTCPDPEHQR